MNLQLFWFIAIIVIFTIFFVLEGFDYGIGILYPWLSGDDTERRVLLNTIGPFWLGNEVWMVCGVGALFAAFPGWYATLFSSLYPLFFLILVALIGRGASIEFRNHLGGYPWRRFWDTIIMITSLLVSICWGIVIANIVRGIPLDGQSHYVGNILDLFNPYALLWGISLPCFFVFYGALFLNLRIDTQSTTRIRAIIRKMWPITAGLLLVLGVVSFFLAPATFHIPLSIGGMLCGLLVLGAIYSTGYVLRHRAYKLSFVLTACTVLFAACSLSMWIFPHVLISSLNPAWSPTLAQTASAPYTLQLVSWFLIVLFPLLVFSQLTNYWIFRRRINAQSMLYY